MAGVRFVRWTILVGILGISLGLAALGVAEVRERASDRGLAKAPGSAKPAVMAGPVSRAGPIAEVREIGRLESTAKLDSTTTLNPLPVKSNHRLSVDLIRLELEEGGGAPKFTGLDLNDVPVVEAEGAFFPLNLAEVAAGTGACCTARP
jgi:hypothetical protein